MSHASGQVHSASGGGIDSPSMTVSPFADPVSFEHATPPSRSENWHNVADNYQTTLSPAPHTPSSTDADANFLVPPNHAHPARLDSFSSIPNDSARNSYLASTPNTPDPSRALLNEHAVSGGDSAVDHDHLTSASPNRSRRRLWLILLGVSVALIVVVLAVVLPVVFVVVKKHRGSSGASGGSTANPHSPTGATTGGDGSSVTTADGTTFTYTNKFGGYWVDDPRDPYNNGARAQSFTPSLNETWDYTRDQTRGVNLGGWLVLEPFIVPALFEKYQNVTPNPAIPGGQAVDEWTLSVAMANDTSDGGGLGQLEDHYKTFITEQDFAKIAGAGLNWVRLPVPYWAIETWPGEPFLAKTAWKYVLLALQWARKYGLRVYLELHTAPGSQNGYNHSGRLGPINFLNGPMGIANAQRTMDYIRVLAEFISQPQYKDVVQMFGVLNEPLLGIIGRDQLERFYLQSYDMLREITGIGSGAYMVIHDGFQGLGPWKDFLPGSDRIVLDTHPYIAFGGGLNQPLDYWPTAACRAFQVNQSNVDFGITITGEFSAAINDCGLWVKGAGVQPSFGDCTQWNDWQNWTQDMKDGIKKFAMASMDAMHFPGYFFWTWKVGNSSQTGKVESPFWSYQLGLENGWIPDDPRDAVGICDTLGVQFNQPFTTQFQPWQTGGSGAGTIAATAVASLSQYPPPVISNADGPASLLPQYTSISPEPTLPVATYSAATASSGDGWADPSDTALAVAPVPGCIYPDAWNAPAASTSFVCGAAAAATPAPAPAPALSRRISM
ncbi:glycoside hydrolase [Panus rudis PR-1116 ss-1]|nr:glycoside hydrolase [Panus rudis PR-1116 ss-1]